MNGATLKKHLLTSAVFAGAAMTVFAAPAFAQDDVERVEAAPADAGVLSVELDLGAGGAVERDQVDPVVPMCAIGIVIPEPDTLDNVSIGRRVACSPRIVR